MKNKKQLTQ